MTKSEMRFIRRDIINNLIHENYILYQYAKPLYTLANIKSRVREWEYVNFGYELKVYS